MENFGKFWRKKMENFGKSWEFLGNFERFHALSCGKKLSPKITFVEKNVYYEVWKKRKLFLTLLRSLGQLLDCGLYWCKCLVILKISSLNPTNSDIINFTLFIYNLLENLKCVFRSFISTNLLRIISGVAFCDFGSRLIFELAAQQINSVLSKLFRQVIVLSDKSLKFISSCLQIWRRTF